MIYFSLCVLAFLFCLVVYLNNKLNRAIHLGEKATKLAELYRDRCYVYCVNYKYLCLYIQGAQVDSKFWREQLDQAVQTCEDDINKFEATHKEN